MLMLTVTAIKVEHADKQKTVKDISLNLLVLKGEWGREEIPTKSKKP